MFTILNLVSAGIGVSLVPRAARAMHVSGVKFAPVHSSYAEWDIGMAWNKKLESEIIRKFADACRRSSATLKPLAGQVGNPHRVGAGAHIVGADDVRALHDGHGFRRQGPVRAGRRRPRRSHCAPGRGR